jgi:type II secretory pathway pseudopilin PulG
MKDQKGFSLVQVIIVAGMLGGLSLVFMQLMKNAQTGNIFVESSLNVTEIKRHIMLILDDERYCKVSLAETFTGENFYRSDINDSDDPNEGLDIALYYSNMDGTARAAKMFNGSANNPGGPDVSKKGKATIKSLKLYLNNGVNNYPDNPNPKSEMGIIKAIVEKKISSEKDREVFFSIPIHVSFQTGPDHGLLSGQSRIVDCQSSGASSDEHPPGSVCGMNVVNNGTQRIQVLCQGHDPKTSCPAGFTQEDFGYYEAGGGSRWAMYCMKAP